MAEPTIRVDTSKQELYVMKDSHIDKRMPCSTGTGIPADGYNGKTPNGIYRISEVVNSSRLGWPNHDSPRKPYGPHLCYLETLDGKDTSMGIHGTDEPDKLGQAITHGCIRVSNENIAQLVKDGIAKEGTLVEIIGG